MPEKNKIFFKFESATPANGAANLPSDISLMAVGDAIGHDIAIDDKSLEGAFTLLQGRSLKSFNNHDWSPKPTDIIGYFSGVYIDTEQHKLRAKSFSFLKSIDPEIKNKLTEIVVEHADTIGISLTTELDVVWVMDNGDEIICEQSWYPPKRPEGCSAVQPVARFTRIISGDFVSDPAANPDGMFGARNPDNENQKILNSKNKEIEMKKILEIFQKRFGANPKLLALAVAKLAAGEVEDETKAKEVCDEIESDDELQKIKDELAAAKAENAELKSKLAAAESETCGEKKKNDELSAKLKSLGMENFSTGARTNDPTVKISDPNAALTEAVSKGDFAAAAAIYATRK